MAGFEQIAASGDAERYAWFLREVAANGLLWILCSEDGDLAFAGDGDAAAVCLWPHERFAAAAAARAFGGLEPRAIGWDEWRTSWVPWLAEWGQRLVGPFPSALLSGVTVDVAELEAAVDAARRAP